MPPVWHACPTGGAQSCAHKPRYMLAQDREEAMEVGCCRDGGTYAECFIWVWDAADGISIIQVLGAHCIAHIRRLVSSGAEYATTPGKVGEDGKYFG